MAEPHSPNTGTLGPSTGLEPKMSGCQVSIGVDVAKLLAGDVE